MKADGYIIIDTKIDDSDFDKLFGSFEDLKHEANGLTKTFDRVGSAIKRAFSFAGVIYAVKQIADFSKEAIKLGSDLQEVQNVVDVTFGELNEVINNFARNAITQFGLSELSAKQYTSTMGAMLKSMGFATDQAAKMSMTMTELAGDMASFYNLDPEEAFTKIRSGISGETEPLKQLGINMSVANLEAYALAQGIGKAYNAMNQQEQALLRYNYLLSVTADAQGDFARTSGSWANQTRILSEQFNSLKASIGQGLINVLTPFVKVINIILSGLQAVADAFNKVTALVFGNASKGSKGSTATQLEGITNGYESAADGAQNLAENTKEAGEAAKRYLAGFDEINKLGEKTEVSSNVPGISEDAFGNVDFGGISTDNVEIEDKISPKIEAIANKIKELIEPLRNIDFTPLKESLSKLGDSFTNLGRTIGEALEWAWFNILVPFATWTIEEAAPAVINLLAEAFDFLNVVLIGLEPLAKALWDNFLKPLAEWTGERVVELLNGLADSLNRISEWISENYEPVNNFIILISSIAGTLGVFAGISKIIEYIGAVGAMAPEVGLLAAMFPKLSAAIANVGTYLTGTLIPSITGTFSAIASALGISVGWVAAIAVAVGAAIAAVIIYWDEIKAFFTTTFPKLLEKASQFVSEKIDQVLSYFESVGPKIQEIVKQVKEKIEEYFTKAASFIEENFIKPVQNWWNSLKETIGSNILRIYQNISGKFTEAAQVIKSNCIDPIKEGFREASEWITDKFTGAKDNIQNIWMKVPGWFQTNVTEPIIDFFNTLTSSVVGGFNKTAQSVSNAIDDLMDAFSRILSYVNGKVSSFSARASSRTSKSSVSTASVLAPAAYPTYPVMDVPMLARGAVIPPNHKFLAVLGDQRSGTNVEAPLSTIQEAVELAMSDMIPAMIAGYEGVMSRQDKILEAILGIELDGESLNAAISSYRRKMTMATGQPLPW